MSNTPTLFVNEGFDIKGAANIDNSSISIVYMVKRGKKLVETARFDHEKGVFIDPPYGVISDENIKKLVSVTKNIVRKKIIHKILIEISA